MRNIFIISPFENSRTGRGVRYTNLSSVLKAMGGCHVFLLTSNFDHGRKVHVAGFDESEVAFRVSGYNSHYGLSRLVTHLQFAFFTALYLYRNLKKDDTIVCSSIPPEVIWVCCVIKLVRRARLVLDVRDVWPDALPLGGWKKRLFDQYCSIIYKFTLRRVDLCMVVSKSFFDWVRRYNVHAEEIFFVPLGYSAERWMAASSRQPEEILHKYVYVGGCTAQFDLRTFSFLGDGEGLAVVGDGPLLEIYKDIYPKAKLYGVLGKGEAADVVMSSQFGLIPGSQYASLPNKAFDFLAAKKAVICNRNTEVFGFLADFGLAVSPDDIISGEYKESASIDRDISDYEHEVLANKMARLILEGNV